MLYVYFFHLVLKQSYAISIIFIFVSQLRKQQLREVKENANYTVMLWPQD